MRTIDPTLRYRSCGWLAWKHRLAGVSFWNSVINTGERWTDLDRHAGDMATVFPTSRGHVNTRRWEAFRDGVEDYQYLHLLTQLAGKAEADRTAAATALIERAVEAMLVEVTEAFRGEGGQVQRHHVMRQFPPARALAQPERAAQALWTPELSGRARELRSKLAEMIAELGKD